MASPFTYRSFEPHVTVVQSQSISRGLGLRFASSISFRASSKSFSAGFVVVVFELVVSVVAAVSLVSAVSVVSVVSVLAVVSVVSVVSVVAVVPLVSLAVVATRVGPALRRDLAGGAVTAPVIVAKMRRMLMIVLRNTRMTTSVCS